MKIWWENISPILDAIIDYFWDKYVFIFSTIFLLFSPVIYGLIRLISNESVKQWILAIWTLVLIIITIYVIVFFIKKLINRDAQREEQANIDKKHFFDKYGLITLKNLLKEKESTLEKGDKVIIYTSKLNTENGKVEEDGEELNIQKVVSENILKGVEYNVLYYIGENTTNKQELQSKYKTITQLARDDNSVDYQLSAGNRSGFDLILYYYHSTKRIEAFFCVNFVDDTSNRDETQNCLNCHSKYRCHPKGQLSDTNPYLLYKQIQDDLATDIFNKLSKKINTDIQHIEYPSIKIAQKVSNEKLFQFIKLIIILGGCIAIPIISNISIYALFKESFDIKLVDVIFCTMLYFILMLSLLKNNMQKNIIANPSSLKKLLEDYCTPHL